VHSSGVLEDRTRRTADVSQVQRRKERHRKKKEKKMKVRWMGRERERQQIKRRLRGERKEEKGER